MPYDNIRPGRAAFQRVGDLGKDLGRPGDLDIVGVDVQAAGVSLGSWD